MENIILLFFSLFIGVAFQFVKVFPKNMHVSLNQYVIYAALPALALFYIPKISISSNLLYPLGIAWLGFGLSFLFFYSMGKYYGWSKKLTGSLILMVGLGNTSFVGFPVIQAIYGSEGMKTAIIVDQPGSFLVMSTLGVIVATLFSRESLNGKAMIVKIILFPPIIAFMIALLMSFSNLDFPQALQNVFQRLGSTVTPIALVAVGFQLKFERQSKHLKFLWLGLGFKLLITPLFFFLLYRKLLNASGLMIDVSIMESAMPPMITGVILASSYGLKPKLGSMLIGIGIPLSFLTLAFWYWVLNTF